MAFRERDRNPGENTKILLNHPPPPNHYQTPQIIHPPSSSTRNDVIKDPLAGPRWARCATSAVFKHRTRSPSIMELLTYWVAQSMGLKYTNPVPLVYYSPDNTRIQLSRKRHLRGPYFLYSTKNPESLLPVRYLISPNFPRPKLPCRL